MGDGLYVWFPITTLLLARFDATVVKVFAPYCVVFVGTKYG